MRREVNRSLPGRHSPATSASNVRTHAMARPSRAPFGAQSAQPERVGPVTECRAEATELAPSACTTTAAVDTLLTGVSCTLSECIARHPRISAINKVTARNAALKAAKKLPRLRNFTVGIISQTIPAQSQPILNSQYGFTRPKFTTGKQLHVHCSSIAERTAMSGIGQGYSHR